MTMQGVGSQSFTGNTAIENSAQAGKAGSTEAVFNGFSVSGSTQGYNYINGGGDGTFYNKPIKTRSIRTLIRDVFLYLTCYISTASMERYLKVKLAHAEQQLAQERFRDSFDTLIYVRGLMKSSRTGARAQSALSDKFDTLLMNTVVKPIVDWTNSPAAITSSQEATTGTLDDIIDCALALVIGEEKRKDLDVLGASMRHDMGDFKF